MKILPLCVLLAAVLAACGDIQPSKSACFGPSGSASCTFVPLAELHAKGR